MTKASAPKCCPICNSKKISLFWNRCWRRNDIKVYRCDGCSVIFLNPMMDDPESGRYYLNYVSHLTTRGVALNETPEQTFKRREKTGSYRIEIARKLVKHSFNVLEIGGGCGNFIGGMLDKKLISSGTLVESCREHLDYAGGKFNLECHQSLEDLPEGKFDAIFMFHVLEHIRQPGGFLRKCSSLLRKKGLFIVEVPCSSDPLLSLYGCEAFKDFYFQPMHHHTYSENSLRHTFGKAGFIPSSFIFHQRYSLLNHLNWLSTGKPGGKLDFNGVIDDLIEKQYKTNLIKNRTTDTIFGVFVKK
ncbi:MAG TPA: methyltransferase [Lentisphaeria bacterium]|nr:MAG: hypothetical protein A2X48_18310 [Lentisphaerae bacterium GWF2_49_21]HBC87143.1 methyltransferase [Lentisphaeria bacterium]